MRLIDADALLKSLKDNGTISLREDGCRYDDFIYYSDAVDLITNATTIQREEWVSVPIEPTPAMLHAMWANREVMRGESENKIARVAYSNMLSAAPTDKE